MKFTNAEGATPLDPEDLKGLIPKHISTQRQLNEWEHANILSAEKWAFARKHSDLVSISFIRLLHKKMFDKTWIWAGEFRIRQTNIGVEWHQISTQLKLLCDDINYHLSNRTYQPDELAVRFHHRLVFIHPFPNGNGRHARLMANLLLAQTGQKLLAWGLSQRTGTLAASGDLRNRYLIALREADHGNFDSLLAFARS